MSLSAKVEYACIAMVDLAVMARADRPVQQKKMAERHEIPTQFLVQILQQLKAAGLVTSTRGASGGYQLARPAEAISLWDIVMAVQGDSEKTPFEQRSSYAAEALRETWNRIFEAEKQILQETRLNDLAQQTEMSAASMYFI
jgi:Rrf2 family protein